MVMYGMGKFPFNLTHWLGGFCLAFVAFSAVNLASANYIYDASTRTWHPTSSTVLAPPNSSRVFVSSPGVSPNPRVSNGAFTTTSGGSFGSSPVNGVTRNVPVTINGTVTKPNVNRAVSARLLRGNLAGLALGVGLQALLDGIDAVIDDAGNVSRFEMPDSPVVGDCEGCVYVQAGVSNTCSSSICIPYWSEEWERIRYGNCSSSRPGGRLFIGHQERPAIWCVYSDTLSPLEPILVPVSSSELDVAIDSSYNPDPSDYPVIVSEPEMAPTVVTVDPIPRLNFPSVITESTDLGTGQTAITETNVWHDFYIKDNDSEQPKIESQETTQTDIYIDGNKTNESTSTTSSGVATDGASNAGKLEVDIPTDCDFMPTVCAFLDWFKADDDELSIDPDFSGLIDTFEPDTDSVQIGDETASCPEPYTVSFSMIPDVQVSFEPFCSLADKMRPFLLALAYFFSAGFLLRNV